MNQSSELLRSVEEIPMLHRRLFGYEIDFYDAMELLELILRRTGAIAIKHFLFKGTIDNFELKLPCNVHSIKYVCRSRPMSFYSSFIEPLDYNYLLNYRVDQSGNLGLYNEDATNVDNIGPNNGESVVYEFNKNVFSLPVGSLVDFTNDGNHCLNFNYKNTDVDVLYAGPVLDENGYFKLPEKTLEAVCYYLHYIEMRKRFNNRQADQTMLQLASAEKDRAIGAARTPVSLSTNETDMILNAYTSFNRKRHNRQMRTF